MVDPVVPGGEGRVQPCDPAVPGQRHAIACCTLFAPACVVREHAISLQSPHMLNFLFGISPTSSYERGALCARHAMASPDVFGVRFSLRHQREIYVIVMIKKKINDHCAKVTAAA